MGPGPAQCPAAGLAGRKLAHVNLLAPTHEALLEKVRACAALLPEAPAPAFSFE